MTSRTRRILGVSLLALLPATALAGPPLVCFPMSIGRAASLPWGDGWKDLRADYDRSRLASDTLALLTPQARVLVRMETLRRAALYAASDATAARALLAQLRARVANGTDALARFDLGYAVEAYRQARHGAPPTPGEPVEDGQALVKDALAARGPDPEMAYAAALLSIGSAGDWRGHLQAAAAGATDGSDLARTLAAHTPVWGERLKAARTAAAR